MTRSRSRKMALWMTAAMLVAGAAAAVTPAASSASAAEDVTVQPLFFLVEAGPEGQERTCSVVADLYLPARADSGHRVPALLMTNGFGGSKAGFGALGPFFARAGYATLAYSGLGFGGSGCKITIDDPDWDGRAASALIGYLGGETGTAYLDAGHTIPAPALDVVTRDTRAHDGTRRAHDPRVGMYGGSYGGSVQFAAASVDPRLDTIVPIATWNDLRYALGPNNLEGAATPGATKLQWGVGFSAVGMSGTVTRFQDDPSRAVGCPNFAEWVCPALVTAATTGYFTAEAEAAMEHASVTSYLHRVRIPTLLVQGQWDTLFNLNEAVRTYQGLRRQRTPVSMIWMYGGHSKAAAPGELSETDPRAGQYVMDRVLDWYDRHLRCRDVDVPRFAYFRDWIDYEGSAAPAYRELGRFRSGADATAYLSGDGRLVSRPEAADRGALRLTTPGAGIPSTLDPLDVGEGFETPNGDHMDAPATGVSWTGDVLDSPLTIVGSPTLTFRVDAPSAALTQAGGPGGQLVLFLKLADVGPDGKARLIKRLEAPVRIPDVGGELMVRFPAVVHRFAAGHRVRLAVSGGSVNYRGGVLPTPVSIPGGATQVLRLPVER